MFNFDRAVQNFAEATSALQRSSITMVSSAIVALIIGQHLEDEPKEYSDTAKVLWEAVSALGLKQAMVYRYLGLARQAANAIEEKYVGSVLAEILNARAATSAQKVVGDFFAKEKITSLDGLGEWLGGAYQRTKVRDHTRATPGTTAETTETEGEVVSSPGITPTEAELSRSPLAIMHDIVENISDVLILRQLRAVLDARIAILEEKEVVTSISPKSRNGNKAGKGLWETKALPTRKTRQIRQRVAA